jgi:hypothetical protein
MDVNFLLLVIATVTFAVFVIVYLSRIANANERSADALEKIAATRTVDSE